MAGRDEFAFSFAGGHSCTLECDRIDSATVGGGVACEEGKGEGEEEEDASGVYGMFECADRRTDEAEVKERCNEAERGERLDSKD